MRPHGDGCSTSIASGIDGPRLFRHEGLPVGPPWPDVQRLIASAGGDSARDIRDRAILILLATYGFRSGEVAGLCLEDLNWESELISFSRPKPRRAQEYPLVSQAGEAILRYLQQVRPRCARREVFLSLKAPFRRLSQGALYHLVSIRLGALGIQVPRRGPHSLRHYAEFRTMPRTCFDLPILNGSRAASSAYSDDVSRRDAGFMDFPFNHFFNDRTSPKTVDVLTRGPLSPHLTEYAQYLHDAG